MDEKVKKIIDSVPDRSEMKNGVESAGKVLADSMFDHIMDGLVANPVIFSLREGAYELFFVALMKRTVENLAYMSSAGNVARVDRMIDEFEREIDEIRVGVITRVAEAASKYPEAKRMVEVQRRFERSKNNDGRGSEKVRKE